MPSTIVRPSIAVSWVRLFFSRPTWAKWQVIELVIKMTVLINGNPYQPIACVLVPPGVVHGYKAITSSGSFSINLPDKLYAGEGKKEKVDEIIAISTDDAERRTKKLALENGLLVGISSGANILAAERWIKENNPSGIVFTILCDRGERYCSILDS